MTKGRRVTAGIPFPRESSSQMLGVVQDTADAVDITMQCFLRQIEIGEIARVGLWIEAIIREWIGITSAYEHMVYPELPLWNIVGRKLEAPRFQGPGDDWLERHPMMLAEQSRQDLDLDVLAKIDRLTPEVMDAIRLCSQQEGIRPPGWETLCNSMIEE